MTTTATKKPAAKSEIISERVWLGDQSWCFQRVFKLQAHRLRIDIRHNAYDFQSHARIERWDGTRWQVIHSIPGQALKLYSYVNREPPKVAEVFEKDAQEMLRVAREVLG